MEKTIILHEIANEGIFKIGGHEFIKFTDEDGVTTAVSKDILFNSCFGKNNNLALSDIMNKLKSGILPEIESIVGEENVLEFETDLLSLDGSAKHGFMKSKISLPTFDFYRRHRAVFEKHKLDKWWWLATPDSTSEYSNDNWGVCVSPSGYICINCYDCDGLGVRPFWNFSSSIFVSCED